MDADFFLAFFLTISKHTKCYDQVPKFSVKFLKNRAFFETVKGGLSTPLDFADSCPFEAKMGRDKNWVIEANFKYFFIGEKAGKTSDSLFSKCWKKNFFQALAKARLEKIKSRKWKISKKSNFSMSFKWL